MNVKSFAMPTVPNGPVVMPKVAKSPETPEMLKRPPTPGVAAVPEVLKSIATAVAKFVVIPPLELMATKLPCFEIPPVRKGLA